MAVVGERERELVVVRDCFGECGISQRWEEIAMEFKVETAEWKDKTRRLQTERIEYERFLRVVEPIALTNETFNKEHDYE